MRNWFIKLTPTPWLFKRLVTLAVIAAVGVGSFCWGRRQSAGAQPGSEIETLRDGMLVKSGDQGRRVVAYVYNNIPVTREELGEYLIDRLGAERLDFMVNRKIVDMECRKYNILVTDREVDERLQQDLRSFGGGPTPLTERDFVHGILKRFGKTLYEWREDVIRPKLMMEKLVVAKVKITEDDMREGFEARYGPRVECRMIVLDKGNLSLATKIWESARKSRANFLEEARKQYIPNLAAVEGKVPPIHKHFGDKQLEESAFSLKEGDVSALLEMQDKSYVILLCEKHLPANTVVRYQDERLKLHKEMFELRVAQRIPEAFAELRQQASPRTMLNNPIQQASHVALPPMPREDPPAKSLPPLEQYEFNPRPIDRLPPLNKVDDSPALPPIQLPPIEVKKK